MPSDWTVDTLHEHLLALIGECDRRTAEGFLSHEKAVGAALVAAREAVAKAELATEKRFDAANEFRAQLAEQATTFMPRREAEQRIAQNAEKIEALAASVATSFASIGSRLDLATGKSNGLTQGYGYLVGGVGFAAGLVSIVIALGH